MRTSCPLGPRSLVLFACLVALAGGELLAQTPGAGGPVLLSVVADSPAPAGDVAGTFPVRTQAAPAAPSGRPWVTVYYPFWIQRKGSPAVADLDFSCFTHIVHFAVLPTQSGWIDLSANGGITWESARALIDAAHARGRKVLISVGGAGSQKAFRSAMSAANRANFVKQVARLCTDFGYDGVDLDMEPIGAADTADLVAFVRALRGWLKATDPRLLLTAATQWQPRAFSAVSNDLDQVNLMTYDLSGNWPGFPTWHNSPVDSGGQKFADGRPLPSVAGMVQQFLDAGVPRVKLGAGIDCMGYIWKGVSNPNQSTRTVTSVQGISYRDVMSKYFKAECYRWEDGVEASYLSIDQPGTANDAFISFDSRKSAARKVAYVKRHGLGGVIVWDIGSGHRPDQPAGKRDPLLQAIKQEAFGQ